LSSIKSFNLMFKTYIGAIEDEKSDHISGQDTQLIFVDFKTVHSLQEAIAFRDSSDREGIQERDLTRNFVFRCREFSQMEIEYFIHPNKLNECPYILSVIDDSLPVCTAEMQA